MASGQDARLDPVLVGACRDLVAPQAGALRASGQFGQEVEPADAGDAQARLLAVLGRHG